MTRQQILDSLARAGVPLSLARGLSDADLQKYAETSCRKQIKAAEAQRLRKYAERNRAQFARFGQTPEQVVKAFEADKVTCFAEEYAPGIASDKLDAGPSFASTGDEKDTPERKLSRKTSLDKERPSALTDDEKMAKLKESYKVRKWAEANKASLEGRGSSVKKVVDTFMADDNFSTAEDFIGK
jgi:hypothetical protein